jgi:hypothetical protein
LPPNSSRLDCKCHAMHVFKPIILTRDLAPLCSSRIYIYIYIACIAFKHQSLG